MKRTEENIVQEARIPDHHDWAHPFDRRLLFMFDPLHHSCGNFFSVYVFVCLLKVSFPFCCD